MKKLYEESDVQAIADAIRAKKNVQLDKVGTMKINAMTNAISKIRLGCPINVSVHMKDGEWIRPEGWTDLDALEYGEDELYMTFDASERIDDSHCSFVITGTAYTVEINGQTWSKGAEESFAYAFTTSDGTYPLVHVKANSHITSFCFEAYTVDGRTYDAQQNPLLERVGDVYDYGSSYRWNTVYLEREKVMRHVCKSLGSTWNNCYSLQSLDLSGWNTSNWAVTSLGSTWNNCCSLQSLDLSGWDTSKWAVTSLGNTWNNCYSLQSLDLSGWNTSNWAVTSLGSTWYNCCSLQSLDLSGWDTSKWAVTSLGNTWNNCYSLQSLDLSGWNTSNWAVTSLGSTWYNCCSLQSLDLSGWDTSKWAVTSLGNTWNNCYSLQSLDLSGWNTSNWAVTSLGSTWYNCCSLQSLDLSGWDTSKWAVTSLGSTWYNCCSLQSLDLSGWDTSKWAVTSLGSTWYNCYSLQSLDLSGWNTSKWNIQNMERTFYGTVALQSLKISSIDMSKVTQWGSTSYRIISGVTLSDFTCGENNYNTFAPTNYMYLVISNSSMLTRKSLIEFGRMLGTVTTKHYIVMGSTLSSKLTEEEKAEITAKGWTIS